MNARKTKVADAGKLLAFLCPLVYFASYLTRKDYSIVMEAILQNEGIGKDAAGLVETLSLVSYGVGQVISGLLGDRFRPQRLIAAGLGATSVLNVLLPLCPTPSLRAAVWFLNGFAQSLLWPPMVRIMTAAMDQKQYNNACVNINIAGISGTVFIYLTSSLLWIGAFGKWQYTFFADALISALILVLWVTSFQKIDQGGAPLPSQGPNETASQARLPIKKLLFGSGFLCIAFSIICQGMLRDGITDWVPSFIANTFRLQSDKAILKSVLLPVLGVISLKLVGLLNRLFVKEEVRAAGLTFLIATVCCCVLLAVYTRNQYITLITSAIIVGAMHGVNLFLVSIVPSKFAKYGLVSTMSGIINSLTYVGSAAAIYGFGLISEQFGWNVCLIVWCVVAALGAGLCFFAVRPWRRFKKT